MSEHLPINSANETDDCFAPSDQLQGCRVVKVGGSILFPPDVIGNEKESARHLNQLRTRIKTWNQNHPASLAQATVWIAGTGQLIERFKKAETKHRLSATSTHWICIEFMDKTAEILGSQFPSWSMSASLAESTSKQLAAAAPGPPNIVLVAYRWLLHAAAKRIPPVLPESSDVTSDSIAAWVAIQSRASQLILLKSCAIPSDDVQALSKRGIVDPHLPDLSPHLRSNAISLKCEQI